MKTLPYRIIIVVFISVTIASGILVNCPQTWSDRSQRFTRRAS